jgi:hypothetical protein
MITVQLMGGLGNQMFQYAAGFALARQHQVPLCLDLGAFAHDPQRAYNLDVLSVAYDSLKTDPWPVVRKRRGWRRWLLGKKPRALKSSTPVYSEQHFKHYDADFPKLTPPLTLSGYFQSPLYFAGYEDILRQQFQLNAGFAAHNNALVNAIASQITPSVALHIRRGDYLDPGVATILGLLPLAYYQKAVHLITALHGEDVHFFIFSNDPDWAEEHLTFCPQRTIVRGNEHHPEQDMHLMALCQHHIIANSTFSWWGAWFGTQPHKTVIAPRAWFTPQTQRRFNVTDLFPEEWILT